MIVDLGSRLIGLSRLSLVVFTSVAHPGSALLVGV